MQNIAYCSDKYQYTMGKSFYDNGFRDKTAIFNLFYRKAPENNNWAVVSGVEEVLEMVEGLGKMPEEFFEKFLPGESYAEFRKYLAQMKFTGNIYAMREGEIAFPNQPVITVEGPMIEAQVLETPMLCIMNHQMAVATKASRVCRATNKPVSEFGSRRAHGPWAAVYGAKAAIIAGCSNTSNILTGAVFDCGSTGTMAHSYVTSFGCSVAGEYKAFDSYIKSHTGETLILLVDTYDTLKCGILNAVRAYRDNGIDDTYPQMYGIRLDSGDLAYLSTECRRILDEHGMKKCRIFATNSLDEYYGVGDAIATSKANPCFGNVYKLVQIGNEPVLKRSEDKAKLINPGFQITYRIMKNDPEAGEIFKADVTCLRGDALERKIIAGESFTIYDEFDRYKFKTFEAGSYKAAALQEKVMERGRICCPKRSLADNKAHYDYTLSHFSPSERRLINPHYYKVDISDALYDLKMSIINKLSREINEFHI